MNEKLFYISELIQKHLHRSLTSEEKQVLNEWVDSSEANSQLFKKLNNKIYLKESVKKIERYDLEKNRGFLYQILKSSGKHESEGLKNILHIKTRKVPWRKLAIAASIMGFVLWMKFLLPPSGSNIGKMENFEMLTNDVNAPERNKALLKLANGQILNLDSMDNGSTVTEKGISVVKTEDGKIVYQVLGNSIDQKEKLVYNTLSNPMGSKVIDIQLSDGTHAWLNAGSSISFPVTFLGNERQVKITGEAYFEVSKDYKKPFVVLTNTMSIRVLGTHFNVNAYDDEGVVKTTLLEGSVLVEHEGSKVVLVPGEQAKLTKNGSIEVDDQVNVEAVMSWKNGSFYFEEADIKTVLRQVSRWYDVEVFFEGAIPDGHYKGKPSKTLTLTQMLKVIEYSGVKFRVEGKKLIIGN